MPKVKLSPNLRVHVPGKIQILPPFLSLLPPLTPRRRRRQRLKEEGMEVGQKKGKGGLGSADWERMRTEGIREGGGTGVCKL